MFSFSAFSQNLHLSDNNNFPSDLKVSQEATEIPGQSKPFSVLTGPLFIEVREQPGDSKMHSPDVALNSNSDDSSEHLEAIPARPKRTIFVDGFVNNRLHNQSLLAIIHDLLPTYYLTSNPTSTESGSRAHVREMLTAAEAILFLMNEFTLNDKRCLHALQHGWELMIPVIMLRHPRMKLIINPLTPADKIRARTLSDSGDILDMSLLQDILYEGYKNSVVYDRFQHSAGIKQIKARLRSVLQPQAGLSTPSPFGQNLAPNNNTNPTLKLPPIRSNGTRSPHLPRRSRSISGKIGGPNGRKKGGKPRTSKDDSAVPQPDRENNKDEEEEKASGMRSRLDSLLSANSVDTEDSLLYQQTQYLIFPLRDKSQKPKLINFPGDVLDDGDREHLDLKSIWGSESSLEDEFKYADDLQGNLDIISPPLSPAPYLGPLE